MLEERITEEELQFMEMYYSPNAMIECLVPENWRAAHLWSSDDCKMLKIRRYQDAMINYAPMYADDPKLSEKDNFQNKINAGNIYNISSRNIGKSLFLIFDAVLNFIYGVGDEACLSAFDYKHLKKITTFIANYINYHPFLQILKRQGKSNARFSGGGFEAENLNGYTLYGKNEKIDAGDDAGTDFQGIHAKWWGVEEISKSSLRGFEQKIDAIHSHGCIERYSGLCDSRLGSPLGQILKNPKNKKFICRLPQSIRNDYSLAYEEMLAEKYGGRERASFRLNVLGEIIEGAEGFWDMARLRKIAYKEDKKVKWFEIGKENFSKFKNIIILDKSAYDRVFICADIGAQSAPTEIILVFQTGTKLKYRYNITLNGLLQKEQAQVFYWLYQTLDHALLGLDASDGTGRGVIENLISLGVSQADITGVEFNAKITVGFIKNDQGHVLKDAKGKPIYREEWTSEWSFQELSRLIYEGFLEIYAQDKFLAQFAGIIEMPGGNNRTKYDSTTENHLSQSFQTFAITYFLNEFNKSKNNFRQKRCLGVI